MLRFEGFLEAKKMLKRYFSIKIIYNSFKLFNLNKLADTIIIY